MLAVANQMIRPAQAAAMKNSYLKLNEINLIVVILTFGHVILMFNRAFDEKRKRSAEVNQNSDQYDRIPLRL